MEGDTEVGWGSVCNGLSKGRVLKQPELVKQNTCVGQILQSPIFQLLP